MDFLIIGAGSLGCLFGGLLAQTNNKVWAYCSGNLQDHLKVNKLIIQNMEGSENIVQNFHVAPNISYFINTEKIPQIIIIATKAYSLKQVCDQYEKLIPKSKMVFLLQNGLGNEDIIRKRFPKIPLYRIITSNGAFMEELGKVKHTGKGETIICRISDSENIISKFKDLEDLVINNLNQAGLRAQFSQEPKETIWKKAIINIGINAFGAITHLRNGELIKTPKLKEIMKKTVEEAIKVAKSLEIPLNPKKDYFNLVIEVIKATQINKNSMLQDFLKKRRTEIDFLNGKIVDYGKNLGIKTPYNETLTALINAIEKTF